MRLVGPYEVKGLALCAVAVAVLSTALGAGRCWRHSLCRIHPRTHAHARTHTHTHTYIHIHTYTHTHAHVHAYILTYIIVHL